MRKMAAPRQRQTSDARTSDRLSRGKTRRAALRVSLCAVALSAAAVLPERAEAQEILLTGPLKGAGSVHDLRLYRKGRLEFAPTATVGLLDEYLRQVLVGARLNYNITDFLAIGAWGGYSPEPLQFEAGLVDRIQIVNEQRGAANLVRRTAGQQPNLQNRLTSSNVGNDFEDQLGSFEWIVAPQITFVPFRGKIALFSSIYIDSDLYFFAGPAIASVNERADCSGPLPAAQTGCTSEIDSGLDDADGQFIPIPNAATFPMASRIAIAPTFGLGFTFYVNRWNALGFEWRAVPFARNTGGFDNHGGGPDGEFPNQTSGPEYAPVVDSDDRDLKLNQMLSVSWNFYIPFDYQVSE